MNCNAIAPFYRFLEYAAFGGRLQKHRLGFADVAKGCRTALVLGDGDGRFVAELARRNPGLAIDAVDVSSEMIGLARRRAKGLEGRIQFLLGDARTLQLPRSQYDLVASHFFLDCFGEEELRELAARIAGHVCAGGHWIVSDFHKPAGGWRAIHAQVWLTTMYWFFRWTTGLGVRRLPPYEEVLREGGFRLVREGTSRAESIKSQLWRRGSDELNVNQFESRA